MNAAIPCRRCRIDIPIAIALDADGLCGSCDTYQRRVGFMIWVIGGILSASILAGIVYLEFVFDLGGESKSDGHIKTPAERFFLASAAFCAVSIIVLGALGSLFMAGRRLWGIRRKSHAGHDLKNETRIPANAVKLRR